MNSFLWRHSVIVEERSDDGANAVTDFVGLVRDTQGIVQSIIPENIDLEVRLPEEPMQVLAKRLLWL